MLDVTTGSENTALGMEALRSATTGSRNVALGRRAGYAIATGNSNILIGHEGGTAAEGYTIRIGAPHVAPDADPGSGQNRTFIAGIANVFARQLDQSGGLHRSGDGSARGVYGPGAASHREL